MTLVINGRSKIEDQEKWVKEYFSPIKNINVTVPDMSSPPAYTPENLSRINKFVPVQDSDILSL